MNIRAVLFDLDGTLVDSLEDLTDAVNHIRSAYSLPPLPTDAVRLKIGKGALNLVEQVLPGVTGEDIHQALARFLEFNKRHIADKSRLYPGIADMLHELAVRNIKLAVISNKHEELTALILRTLGIHDLFDSICGGNTFSESKPSPLPLLNVMDNLAIAPSECVMVGDSNNDILAGQQANVPTIACTWGYGSADELAGATAYAISPEDLLCIIAMGPGRLP